MSLIYLILQIWLPLTLSGGQTTEMYSGASYTVQGQRAQVSVPGARGEAWRTDAYSSYLTVPIAGRIPNNALGVNMRDSVIDRMTISFWMAAETYPLMTPGTQDFANPLYASVIGNINDSLHTGFVFELSNTGRYRFRCYSSGWHILCDAGADRRMPLSGWQHIVATIDGYNQRVTLYNNGEEVASAPCMYDVSLGTGPLLLGRGSKELFDGMFAINYFNGLLDEVRIEGGIQSAWITDNVPENFPSMNLPNHTAYAQDICRPRYHGMPSQNWTNESHGLCYNGGRWHIFFQKNGCGPQMSKLHWGHISSPDMFHWVEEPVAMIPYESYDIKGCWSGCIFRDDEITGGQHWALYSGIDDNHCELIFADPLADDMIAWHKQGWPRTRCSFRDDFRDPYFFSRNGRKYIIVGCAHEGLGIATLQKWNGDVWLSDGDIFFKATALADAGSFWEMPTVTHMGNDRWLFTCTPMSTSYGVRTLYWAGGIDDAGHFHPDNENPGTVELAGLAREGYGLLSPSIYQKDGKTIALGIVPDKVSSRLNYELGWAHCYSFPREWSLEGSELVQRPYSGLRDLRTPENFARHDVQLADTTLSLNPVEGRSIELLAEYVLGRDTLGFTLLKNTYGGMKVYIDPVDGKLVVDMTTISRRANDTGLFDGLYAAVIPGLNIGQVCTLNIFFDHSILDIFVNNRYATSIRVYPYDFTANGCEAWVQGESSVQVNHLEAYGLGEITHYTRTTDMPETTSNSNTSYKLLNDGQLYIKSASGNSLYDAVGRLVR